MMIPPLVRLGQPPHGVVDAIILVDTGWHRAAKGNTLAGPFWSYLHNNGIERTHHSRILCWMPQDGS